MNISRKLQKWVDQKLISQAQANKIMIFEQSKHSSLAWKLMYWLAGLLIGLGFILIIGSNWDDIPAPVKLFCDFAIWAGILYAAYWSMANNNDKLKELFLTLSFLCVGATIGLIGQTFNLSGGWQSFAVAWAILSLPFIISSRLTVLNIAWLLLLLSSVDTHALERLAKLLQPLGCLAIATALFASLNYAGNRLYIALKEKILLPKAFAALCFFEMYLANIVIGISAGLETIGSNHVDAQMLLAIIFVFAFFGVRLLLAIQHKNIKSFINNTRLIELYILFLFVTRFGNLFMSGVGFVIGGLLLLGVLYLLKRTSKYIKTMEVFHE